jgi:hypothetical protein
VCFVPRSPPGPAPGPPPQPVDRLQAAEAAADDDDAMAASVVPGRALCICCRDREHARRYPARAFRDRRTPASIALECRGAGESAE